MTKIADCTTCGIVESETGFPEHTQKFCPNCGGDISNIREKPEDQTKDQEYSESDNELVPEFL